MDYLKPKSKRVVFAAASALGVLLSIPLATSRAQNSSGTGSDEAALRQIVADFMNSWNRHDAHSMCVALAEDGDFISWRGERFHGRKSFEDYHASLFAGLYKNTQRSDDVRNIRFLTPEIASVDDYWTMTGAKTRDGADWPYREGLYHFLMTKQSGHWIVAVGGYFRDPTGTGKQTGSSMSGAGETLVLSKDNMEDLKEQLQKTIREIPNFEKFKNNVDMTVTNEGLRIELTESATGTFFDSGSAKISKDGKDLLDTLAEELGKLPNKLAFEGHTDSKPYAEGSNYGNWELSADRANAARRLMVKQGIRGDQVTQVRGFADQRLRKKDAPMDPSNRRISMIVQYVDKKPSEEPAPAGNPTEAKPEAGEKKAEKSSSKE